MGPGVDLPDGPSGRIPIACAHLDTSSYSEDYLVLFDDGTLGTQISDESTPWHHYVAIGACPHCHVLPGIGLVTNSPRRNVGCESLQEFYFCECACYSKYGCSSDSPRLGA